MPSPPQDTGDQNRIRRGPLSTEPGVGSQGVGRLPSHAFMACRVF